MAVIKLTLTVEEESLPFVKRFAKRQHTSVSKLVQNLFDDITQKEKSQPDPILEKYKNVEIPEWITNLSADVKIDPTMDYDKVKHEYLKEKYGS